MKLWQLYAAREVALKWRAMREVARWDAAIAARIVAIGAAPNEPFKRCTRCSARVFGPQARCPACGGRVHGH